MVYGAIPDRIRPPPLWQTTICGGLLIGKRGNQVICLHGGGYVVNFMVISCNLERSTEPGTVGFMETVEEKMAQGKAADQDEKAFEMVGLNAPQEVKDAWMDAWMDAAKEVSANGMGIRSNGMMSHISQMMVQRLNKQLKGETAWSNPVLFQAQGTVFVRRNSFIFPKFSYEITEIIKSDGKRDIRNRCF